MGEPGLYYACCPKCGKAIVKSKRCDGMELVCSKCGSTLRVTIDMSATLLIELVKDQKN